MSSHSHSERYYVITGGPASGKKVTGLEAQQRAHAEITAAHLGIKNPAQDVPSSAGPIRPRLGVD